MQGDKLASGSISAQFAMPKVTQEKVGCDLGRRTCEGREVIRGEAQ